MANKQHPPEIVKTPCSVVFYFCDDSHVKYDTNIPDTIPDTILDTNIPDTNIPDTNISCENIQIHIFDIFDIFDIFNIFNNVFKFMNTHIVK